jgi:hypothetical protein
MKYGPAGFFSIVVGFFCGVSCPLGFSISTSLPQKNYFLAMNPPRSSSRPVQRAVSKGVEDGQRPPALQVARPQGIEGLGMAGPGETLGSPCHKNPHFSYDSTHSGKPYPFPRKFSYQVTKLFLGKHLYNSLRSSIRPLVDWLVGWSVPILLLPAKSRAWFVLQLVLTHESSYP